MIIYQMLMWNIYKNKLEKLKTRKLIDLWNIFDYGYAYEDKLYIINNVLNERASRYEIIY